MAFSLFDQWKKWTQYLPAPMRRGWALFVGSIETSNVTFPSAKWNWTPKETLFVESGEVKPEPTTDVPASTVEVWYHTLDVEKVDQSTLLNSYSVGDLMEIKSIETGATYFFEVTGPPTVIAVTDGFMYKFPVKQPVTYGPTSFTSRATEATEIVGGEEVISGRVPRGTITEYFVSLLDTPDDYTGQARKILSISDAEGGLVYDNEPVTWRKTWQSQPYYTNDMVIDGAFTMIANKDTLDRAAPQPTGNQAYLIPDVPTWTPESYTGAVMSGIRIIPTQGSFMISSYRFWVANISTNYTYRVVLRDNVTGQVFPGEIFSGAVVSAPGWFEVSIPGRWANIGDDLSLFLITQNSSATTDFNHPWQRGANDQALGPVKGEWNSTNQGTPIRFNKVDFNSVDQTVDLQSVIVGTIIKIISRADVNVWNEYSVSVAEEFTDYIQLDVTLIGNGPSGEVPIGAICDCYFQVPVPDPTGYVRIPNYFAAMPDISGDLKLGETPEVATDDAYGIDVQVQEYVASEDWDLLAYSGDAIGSGGGGGSGFEFFIDLLDTPVSYAGFGGQFPQVKSDETGLEFTALTPAALSYGYRFSTATTPSPVSGYAGINNIDPSLATEMYVNVVDDSSINRTLALGSLRPSDVIAFIDSNSDAAYSYRIIGTPTLAADVYTFPVENAGVRGTFSNNEKGFVIGILFGANEFTDLIDTPEDYDGQAYNSATVKSDETGLEFAQHMEGSTRLGTNADGWRGDTPISSFPYGSSIVGVQAGAVDLWPSSNHGTVLTFKDRDYNRGFQIWMATTGDEVLMRASNFTSWFDWETLNLKTFTELNDTPADYTGAAKQSVRVNAAGDALDFLRMMAGTEELGTSTEFPATATPDLFPEGLSFINSTNTGGYPIGHGLIANFKYVGLNNKTVQLAVQQNGMVMQMRAYSTVWSDWKDLIATGGTVIQALPPTTTNVFSNQLTTSTGWQTVADVSNGPYVLERVYLSNLVNESQYGVRVTCDGVLALEVNSGIICNQSFPDIIGQYALYYPLVFFARSTLKVEVVRTSGTNYSCRTIIQKYSIE